MKVFFTSYRCNCTTLNKTREEIPARCPDHKEEIIYGLSGAHTEVEVDPWQPLGLFPASHEVTA